MGNMYGRARKARIPEANLPLVGMELKRVEEVHRAFKTLCPTFALNAKECEQLLNMSEAGFSIWDSDSNGLIDAMQLFSTLALFSKALS